MCDAYCNNNNKIWYPGSNVLSLKTNGSLDIVIDVLI